jgi:prepilin peptidase CpaA
MVASFLLLALMLIATVSDVRQHKVFNWNTYPGICAALLLSGVADLLNRFYQVDSRWISSSGFGESVAGFLLCGVVMLVCFVFFNVGGGDVKLIAMMGAFLGPERGIESLLWTFILGGACAVIILIWRLGFFTLLRRVVQQLFWKIRLGGWGPLNEEERTQLKLPLYMAPSALLAVLFVQYSIVNRLM